MARIRLLPLTVALSAGVCAMVFAVFTTSGGDPVDALCYWLTDPANPYNRTEFQFVYPPAAAQIMAPLFELPFPAFVALLRAVEVMSLVVLAGPLAAIAIFTFPVASEVNAANINLLLGLLMVLGFRWPALWSVALLTKPSMAVGLLWFVVRGEWRKVVVPVAIAGTIAAISFVFAPRLWFDWLALLAGGTAAVGDWPYPYPIWARLPLAIALVVWGARTNRPWTVVAAAALALPRLYFQSPALLVALIPLVPALGSKVVPLTRRIARLGTLVPTPSRSPMAAPTMQPAAGVRGS